MADTYRTWTKEEEVYLYDNYKSCTYEKIGVALDRTLGSIHSKLHRTGLSRQLSQAEIEERLASVTQVEWAWIAGVLEGEGCFGNYNGSVGFALAMTDKDIVERVASVVQTDCKIGERKRRTNRKTCYTLQVAGNRAKVILGYILPFMGNRRSNRIKELLC